MYIETLRSLRQLITRFHTRLIRSSFKRLDSYLDPSIEIKNPEHISIGKAHIRPHCWIYAITGDSLDQNRFQPSIEIGDGCSIGRFCHITSSNRVVLEENVFLTEGVLITDTIHGYENINIPIIKQPLISLGPVVIGRGSWLGNGARIVGRVTIGKNCIISTNSVVTKNVPDYCIVAGIPARIVKRFDETSKKWIVVDEPLVGSKSIERRDSKDT